MALLFNPDFSMEFVRGDDVDFELALLDDDDVPLDLTGALVRSHVKRKSSGNTLFEFVVTAAAPATGVAAFSAPHTATEKLRFLATEADHIEATYDIEVKWPDDKVQTIFGPADVTILKDVTPPVVTP
jgi:hypothetical protein